MTIAAILCLCTAEADAQETDADNGIIEVSLVDSFAELEGGYLVRPDAPGRRALVILSHGRWDLAEDLRELADRLARRGYAVLLRRPMTTSMRPDDLRDLRHSLVRLSSAPWVDPRRIALVGFCGGGYQSLLLASEADVDLAAVASFYGPLDFPDRFQPEQGTPFSDLFDSIGRIRAPVQGHYGDQDAIIPASDVLRLTRTMDERDREAEIFMYDGAEHGFCDRTHGHYDESACRVAIDRLFEFLDRHIFPEQSHE